jgi:hypothetical protein
VVEYTPDTLLKGRSHHAENMSMIICPDHTTALWGSLCGAATFFGPANIRTPQGKDCVAYYRVCIIVELEPCSQHRAAALPAQSSAEYGLVHVTIYLV